MKRKCKLKVKNKKSVGANLNQFCIFSMGDRFAKGDHIEVSEWLNSEGYDIMISDVTSTRQFFLTTGQFNAMKKCIKTLEKHNEKK